MALQLIGGYGQTVFYPHATGAPSFASATIAATGDKTSFCGKVWIPSGVSKNITRVGFRSGSIVSAGGSGLTISIQACSTSAGAPIQPTETQIKTASLALNTVTSNTWVRSAALNSTYTVNPGDAIAVVIEYDGGGRLGADSFSITSLSATASVSLLSAVVTKTSGAWAAASVCPNIVLEFDDGTWGTLIGAFPCSAINTHTFNSGSSPNEYALAFQVPFSCSVDGAFFEGVVPAGASFSVNLYDGTSVMTGGSISVDAHQVQSTSERRAYVPFTAPVQLSINHQYYIAITPSAVTSMSTYSFDVNDANHLQFHPGGKNFNHATRSGGAWAAVTTTRRLYAGLHISHLDDGTGGGSTGASILGC